MKKYKITLAFYDPIRSKKYLFVETNIKNPAGEILFEGLPTKGKDYLLHFTEFTLVKMGANQEHQ